MFTIINIISKKLFIALSSGTITTFYANSLASNSLASNPYAYFPDVPRKWQLNFQKPASPIMDSIIDLHHDIMFVMLFIVITISYLLCKSLYLFKYTPSNVVNNVKHCTNVEIIWTIIPALILSWIALPSFALLYSLDGVIQPRVTIKSIGHQWYWSYESIDPIYSGHWQNHSSVYKNFVDIYKRYYTQSNTINMNEVVYNDVPFLFFLQELLLKDINEGYSGPDIYVTLASELHKHLSYLFPVTKNCYEILNHEQANILVPDFLFKHPMVFSDILDFNNLLNILQYPAIEHSYDLLTATFENTLISGVIYKKSSSFDLKIDLVYSGSIKGWETQHNYNTYIADELYTLLNFIKVNSVSKLINNSNLQFFSDNLDTTKSDYTYAKYQKHLYPENYHPHIKWKYTSGEFPIFYIPDVNLNNSLLNYNTVYEIKSCFNKDTYSTFGFDYDSCLLSDDALNKKRLITKSKSFIKSYVSHSGRRSFTKNSGWFRLLDVDNRLLVPKGVNTRFLITSADVIHSWAIPSLGLKLDACPGRLNELGVYIKREGVFYGQCSEICGIHHGFMPISLQSTTSANYKSWFLAKSSMYLI